MKPVLTFITAQMSKKNRKKVNYEGLSCFNELYRFKVSKYIYLISFIEKNCKFLALHHKNLAIRSIIDMVHYTSWRHLGRHANICV